MISSILFLEENFGKLHLKFLTINFRFFLDELEEDELKKEKTKAEINEIVSYFLFVYLSISEKSISGISR